MATSSVTRYHGRLNTVPDPDRKEWRQVGRSSLVVAGGTVTPGSNLAITLVASPASPAVGQTVTLSATTTGGVGPFVRTFTQVSGASVTLTGTGGTTRTFVANTAGSRVFRVRVVDDEATTQEATVTVTTAGAPVGQPLYAGHIPNRVVVGLAGGESGNPSFSEGLSIVRAKSQELLGYPGAGAYERRRFTGTQTRGNDAGEINGMLTDGDSYNVINWVSTKVVNNDWAGVGAGNWPAIATMWRNVAIARRSAGKGPFIATMHHEPSGDGNLADWAAMHIWMSNELVDQNDIMAWSAVGNGFYWNTVNGTVNDRTSRDEMFPQELIDTFRVNKHLIAVDTYDASPEYTGQTSYPIAGQNGSRCSEKLQNWISWMRARNCGALGIGEWSVTDVAEMQKVWKVQRDNRDILGVCNYFNSGANSKWDWRLIPNGYQGGSGTIDYGGTPLTEGRLNYWPTIVAESISPTYTSPL